MIIDEINSLFNKDTNPAEIEHYTRNYLAMHHNLPTLLVNLHIEKHDDVLVIIPDDLFTACLLAGYIVYNVSATKVVNTEDGSESVRIANDAIVTRHSGGSITVTNLKPVVDWIKIDLERV